MHRKASKLSSQHWYHLNLFSKFVLTFLGVVALPIIVIVIQVSYQSKVIIADSINQVIRDMTSAIEVALQEQQQASETGT